jgi:hypothetical protein
MATTFYTIPNLASTALISAYTPGDTTIIVADATSFGSPSMTFPIRLTGTKSDGSRNHFKCTGITGNNMTVSVIDGYTDISLPIGSKVSCYVCRESLGDIHVAINALENKFSQGSGAPSSTPADGAVYIDTGSTPKKLYIRAGGAWYSTNIS